MTTEQVARPRGRAAGPREQTHVDEVPAEPTSGEAVLSLSGEMVGARVSAVEWILYGAFFIVGAIMRFWDLGSRALHHDESLHATYSWYLWKAWTGQGSEYHYDPMMHGPYQFHGNALMFLIFGVSDATARYDAAICGTALIALPFLMRPILGRYAALILSGLFAFSPAFLYYSRFTREDIYFALWTVVFFVGLMRWIHARGARNGHRWLYMAAAGFALSWATKESTYFTAIIALGFLIGVFVVAYAYQFLRPARPANKRAEVRENAFVAALGAFSRANLPPVLDTLRGTSPRAWLTSIGIMAFITYILFLPINDPWQWGFIPGAHTQPTTNASGQTVNYNTDFLTGGLSYWKLQQAVARGGQPWYYYFLIIPLYEQVAVVFGAAGLAYYFYFAYRRTRFSTISAIAFVVTALLALFMGESVPHLVDLGLIGLTAISGVALLISQPRHVLITFMLWWTVVNSALYIYAGEKMPWLTLHVLVPIFFVAALYAGRMLQGVRFGRRQIITAAVLAVCTLISFRSSVALAYVDGANPTEMLIYTQTSPDVPMVSKVIHKIPPAPGKQYAWIDGADSWPWVWYMHDITATVSYVGSDTDTKTAGDGVISAAQQGYPVIMVGWEDATTYLEPQDKMQSLAAYTPYEFKLRWWFPEDGYKSWETRGLGGFLSDALNPQSWANVINWWATRTPFDQQAFKTWSNSYRFFVLIRKSLVSQYIPQTGAAGQAWASAHAKALADVRWTAANQTEDVATALVQPIKPLLTAAVDKLPVPMQAVRAVAVDTSGNMYLTDSSAARVVKLDKNGHYVTSWGSVGSGPGQFSNLYAGSAVMGIAVGPNGHVYVSDTWNGRVQEFTPDGKFVRAFGRPNPNLTGGAAPAADSFYGPRQLAIAPNGNLYVADTGNVRIQVYSPQGRHLFNIGTGSHGPETAGGRFFEPSGVAIDRKGIVYVADYWDKRIQRFTLNGTYLSSIPISGWIDHDYSEPYLAVDKAGHLFATDAPTTQNRHVNHVLMMDATTGRLLKAFGAGGSGAGTLNQPSGIAIGPDGDLYIADTTALAVYKVRP